VEAPPGRRDAHAAVARAAADQAAVVQAEPKDLSDLSALLTDAWDAVLSEWARLERLVRDDWGLWRTSRGNLERLAGSADPPVAERAAEALRRWDAIPLSLKAQLRGRVGDRVRWYEEPEEV
jgi:hypothetical protein